ncbi:hypothetical protein [Streptomyces sp. RK75]|uniref:hypothetical protein n=1 Tax=Streptomyces sp. RK75 TaxID=2824895 RepID=UPI001B3985D7|nr:hypothetical protein [Streptomyces sp. RK75]MBQ0862437.1 hypothetical protein [Streptomyces sp. RK75]
MVRKKVEGDEDERRSEAHKAHRVDEPASARYATTGASKQRTHRAGGSAEKDTETPAQRQGKVGHTATQAERRPQGVGPAESRSPYEGRGRPDYSAEHEQVFRALVTAEQQHGGEPVSLDEVSREAHMPQEKTQPLMHDLVTVHHLATELQGAEAPDLSHYETKPRH